VWYLLDHSRPRWGWLQLARLVPYFHQQYKIVRLSLAGAGTVELDAAAEAAPDHPLRLTVPAR